MRSLKDDAFFRNRETAQREFHENRPARAWLAAIRGLRVALEVHAEAQRIAEAAKLANMVPKETP